MKDRHTTLYVNSIKNIELCGKYIMTQVELDGSFEIPFEIEPTTGDEHDYTSCEKCQKTIVDITKWLTERFQGFSNVPAFPLCCDYHKNLIQYEEFVRSKDYFSCVPEMVARKVIFMNQHILNNFKKDNWYEEIKYYMDWVVESFGSMPKNAGEPLYLNQFFGYVWELTSRNKEIEEDKKLRIEEIINSYNTQSINSFDDINKLIKTYEKWLEIFPFRLKEYFGDLKQQFESRLPLFNGKPEVNPYSKMVKVSSHSKRSLILYLNEITKVLIDKIDINELIKDEVIKDINGHRLSLEIESLNVETKELTKDLSEGEKKYTGILKKWLDNHKIFFERITPILELKKESKDKSLENSSPIIVDPS